ncbi:hypothetical protein AWB71_05990 [Caballeronia peredens]|nr:hypothetical protein AWB71_05990 [Caballeronia peredens]
MEIKEIEQVTGLDAKEIESKLNEWAAEALQEAPGITDLSEMLALLPPENQHEALKTIFDHNALSNPRLAFIIMQTFSSVFYIKNSGKQIDKMTAHLEEQLNKVAKRVLIDFHNTLVGQAGDVRRQTLEELTEVLGQIQEIRDGIDGKLDRLVGFSGRVENAVDDIEKLREELKKIFDAGILEIKKEIKEGPDKIRAAATAKYQNDIMHKEVDIMNKIKSGVVDAGKKAINEMKTEWSEERKFANRFWTFMYALAGTGTALIIFSFFK